jgi:hypothetical protein
MLNVKVLHGEGFNIGPQSDVLVCKQTVRCMILT